MINNEFYFTGLQGNFKTKFSILEIIFVFLLNIRHKSFISIHTKTLSKNFQNSIKNIVTLVYKIFHVFKTIGFETFFKH